MTFLGIVILFQVMRKKEKVITHGTNTIYLIGLLYTLSFFSCSTDLEQDNTSPIESPLTGPYTIESSQLLENGQEVHFKGVNALQNLWSYRLSGLMNHWKVQITREFIGNLREQPIDGGAIQASDIWYHPSKLSIKIEQTTALPFCVIWLGKQQWRTSIVHRAKPLRTKFL